MNYHSIQIVYIPHLLPLSFSLSWVLWGGGTSPVAPPPQKRFCWPWPNQLVTFIWSPHHDITGVHNKDGAQNNRMVSLIATSLLPTLLESRILLVFIISMKMVLKASI